MAKDSGPKEGPITRSKAEEIGNRLTLARKEMGMKQEDAAELIGVSVRSISAYETGEIVPWRKLKRISEVYLQPESWILHGDPQPSSDHQLEELTRIASTICKWQEEDLYRILEELLETNRLILAQSREYTKLLAGLSPLVPAGE